MKTIALLLVTCLSPFYTITCGLQWFIPACQESPKPLIFSNYKIPKVNAECNGFLCQDALLRSIILFSGFLEKRGVLAHFSASA